MKAEDIVARPDMALALAARIEQIPEGATAIRKKNVAKGQTLEIKIDNYSAGESTALRGFSTFSILLVQDIMDAVIWLALHAPHCEH